MAGTDDPKGTSSVDDGAGRVFELIMEEARWASPYEQEEIEPIDTPKLDAQQLGLVAGIAPMVSRMAKVVERQLEGNPDSDQLPDRAPLSPAKWALIEEMLPLVGRLTFALQDRAVRFVLTRHLDQEHLRGQALGILYGVLSGIELGGRIDPKVALSIRLRQEMNKLLIREAAEVGMMRFGASIGADFDLGEETQAGEDPREAFRRAMWGRTAAHLLGIYGAFGALRHEERREAFTIAEPVIDMMEALLAKLTDEERRLLVERSVGTKVAEIAARQEKASRDVIVALHRALVALGAELRRLAEDGGAIDPSV